MHVRRPSLIIEVELWVLARTCRALHAFGLLRQVRHTSIKHQVSARSYRPAHLLISAHEAIDW